MSHSTSQGDPDDDRHRMKGPGVALDFREDERRWSHKIRIESSSRPAAIVASFEGQSDRDDPARVVSPAYQEIHRHEADGGIALLLTGQSTPHHFSAAVARSDVGGVAGFEFDVADRCRGPLEVLAATYLVEATSGDLVEATPGRIAWESAAWGPGRLELVAVANATLALAEAGRRATRVQVLAGLDAAGHTHRFVYRWTWRPADTG